MGKNPVPFIWIIAKKLTLWPNYTKPSPISNTLMSSFCSTESAFTSQPGRQKIKLILLKLSCHQAWATCFPGLFWFSQLATF